MKVNGSVKVAAPEEIIDVVRRTWGFDRLRPLQEEAIHAELEGRDSLVVLPTGGGKSLCYQVPPLLLERTDVVVSPLISLMKDQVDSLRACGYPAVSLHSAMSPALRRESWDLIHSGGCRLIFVSPERLLTGRFLEFLKTRNIGAFAIDEAHCISHWGHDFRPEYRRLAALKEIFPHAALHAYTATATERVRSDIVRQLGLAKAKVLVGTFDRPNLIYRVVPRQNLRRQVIDTLQRHRDQAVIVYCISRAETERLAGHLQSQGMRAAYYHAGMESADRRHVQDQFSKEFIDVIVATVAFGMGIDRSDVRCVIHAAMPKSIEHYQQETGRAGRDGLEAECILFHSPADVLRWQSLVDKSAADPAVSEETRRSAARLLDHMRKYCYPGKCRHRSLSEYFGQTLEKDNCGACDVCLEETGELLDGTVTAQKVLSCVARAGQRFGIGHIVDVLRGADTTQIRGYRHDQLSTFGLMKETARNTLINTVYQLIDQGLLERTDGEYPVLRLNSNSLQILKGQRKAWLIPVKTKKVKRTAVEKAQWSGVNEDLFQDLRALRAQLARQRGVPPYVIFSDASLRDMARLRPVEASEFLNVHGVGEKKLADLGPVFMSRIRQYLETQADEGAPSPK